MLVVEAGISAEWTESIDWQALAHKCVVATMVEAGAAFVLDRPDTVEASVRFTNDEEVQALNRDYRSKDKATNVLSFPMLEPDHVQLAIETWDEEILLGDIVLAYETCAREAGERGIAIRDHAAHLLVHGTLHLLGYDHEDDEEAETMEDAERRALARLGIADPYSLPQLTD
jgi:probable rRNA maturation factor